MDEAQVGKIRTAYSILVGKSPRKRIFGRPISRWINNINMGLSEIGCEDGQLGIVSNDRLWY